MAIRVLLAEDQPLLLRLMVEHLSRAKDIQVVGAVSNGREAVRVAEQTRPHVALLDYNLPLLSGGEVARIIYERCPDTLNVILSEMLPSQVVGVVEWWTKAQVQDIAAEIRRLIREKTPTSSPSAPLRRELAKNAWRDVTERQQDTLWWLVTEGLSNKEIAARLPRARGKAVTESAVRKRLVVIMDKWEVEPRNRGRLIQVAEEKLRKVSRNERPL
jgi:DNA-binding NarL/FixJ family response regulator